MQKAVLGKKKEFHCWQSTQEMSFCLPSPTLPGEQERLGTGCHLLSHSQVLMRQAEIITEYTRASFCLQAWHCSSSTRSLPEILASCKGSTGALSPPRGALAPPMAQQGRHRGSSAPSV